MLCLVVPYLLNHAHGRRYTVFLPIEGGKDATYVVSCGVTSHMSSQILLIEILCILHVRKRGSSLPSR
jgi:hypothetical protein